MKYLVIILWVILGFIYFWLWDIGKKECCTEYVVETEVTEIVETTDTSTNGLKSLPLAFNWSSGAAVKGDNFSFFRDSLLNSLGDNEIFEITGYYRAEEVNNTDETDLGIARAKEIRKLFPEIPENRIRLISALIDEKDGERENLFISSNFNNALNTVEIQEIDNSALIYFPFNSLKKLNSSEIESYLDKVADRVISSGETVTLTGNTDDIGAEETNYNLGLKRADVIKDYLLKKGVSADQIKVSSNGETKPLVPNTNNENRAKNRRVELKIIN
ncbi:MAG: OmpA family protein [Saprospiraceae bacterium]